MSDEPHFGLAVRDNDSVLVLSHARSEIVARGRRDAAELISNTGHDCAESTFACRKAAENGNAQAQYELARMYFYGEGVGLDRPEAIRWYRRAAEQDFAQAQFAFGVMCELFLEEYEEAVAWFSKAANQGLIDAQLKMANVYWYGFLVRADLTLAYMWLSVAESGMKSARTSVWHTLERESIAARMTTEQIALAQQLAADWVSAGGAGASFALSPHEYPAAIRPRPCP